MAGLYSAFSYLNVNVRGLEQLKRLLKTLKMDELWLGTC